ncbi:MAG: hypothetical protein MUC51_04935 [Anaerolineae bacterium]|jgi:hypothetical protein|nr:hypothetical protein [Anaerolineae bacterium]
MQVPTLPLSHAPAHRFKSWLSHLWVEPAFVLALLLVIPALLPLAAPGYFFSAHDGRHTVFWLLEFDRAFSDGALWPIWVPDHVLGFGYPLWLVYAPLSFFVAEAFHLLGFGLTAAVKVAWAFWFILGAVGMFRLTRRWWGPGAALVASLAYTYAPYHLVDIYVRAALAEFAALAIAPWALLTLANVWERPGEKNAALAALALGALLLTHSMAPAVFVPLVVGFVAWKALQAGVLAMRRRKTKDERPITASDRGSLVLGRSSFVWTGIALALGFGLAMVFWLPALAARQHIQEASWLQGTYDYARHFVFPSQFFSAFWGFGFSVPGPNDGMSFQLGIVQWVGAVVAALAAFGIARPALRTRRSEALFLVTASLIALIAMTPITQPLWAIFPLAASVQFPWRLLAVTTITLALLVGAATHWLERAASDDGLPGPYVYVLALAIVLAAFPYTRPELSPIRPEDESLLAIVDFEAKYPDMRGMTAFAERPPSQAESPLIAQYLAGQPLQRAAIVAGAGEVIAQNARANSATAQVRADGPVRLRFYTNYFPGWAATVDGQPVAIEPDPPDGLIGLDLPAGVHDVRVYYGVTPVRWLGAAISLAAAVAVIALLMLGLRRSAIDRAAPG